MGWCWFGIIFCWLTLFFRILASRDIRQRDIGHRSFLGGTESSSTDIWGLKVPWFPNVETQLCLLESRPLPTELVDLIESLLSSESVELSDVFLFTDGKALKIFSNIEQLSLFSIFNWSNWSSTWSTFVSTISFYRWNYWKYTNESIYNFRRKKKFKISYFDFEQENMGLWNI